MERGRDEEQTAQKEEEGQANVGSGAAEHRRKKRRKESGNKRQATLHKKNWPPPARGDSHSSGGFVLESFCGIVLGASTLLQLRRPWAKKTPATFHAKRHDRWASPGARQQLQSYGFRFGIVLGIVLSAGTPQQLWRLRAQTESVSNRSGAWGRGAEAARATDALDISC